MGLRRKLRMGSEMDVGYREGVGGGGVVGGGWGVFFFNDTETNEIYTLSLHDALPIYNQHHNPSLLHNGSQVVHSLVDSLPLVSLVRR